MSGTVYAPNASDPIPNVRVYVPMSVPLNPFPTGYCDACSSPIDPAYASTISTVNGSFTLTLDNVPQAATVNVALQVGRFRKWTSVPITACQTTALALAPNANPAEVLPGATMAGVADVPKIAVSAGNVDLLDTILTALGITEFDCFEGRATPVYPYPGSCTLSATSTNIGAALADPTKFGPSGSYNMALLSSAPGGYAKYVPASIRTTVNGNVQQWLAAGGRLFATNLSYDYVAQPFPAPVTWAGPSGTPQPVDGADIGCSPGGAAGHDTLYPITVDDSILAAWLKVVGFPSSPSVSVDGLYEPWAVISSLPTTTPLLANGTMPIDPTITGNMCTGAGTQMTPVPLAAAFEVSACGRAVYSSFESYSGTATGGTAANKRIMEYLIFAAAFCAQ